MYKWITWPGNIVSIGYPVGKCFCESCGLKSNSNSMKKSTRPRHCIWPNNNMAAHYRLAKKMYIQGTL